MNFAAFLGAVRDRATEWDEVPIRHRIATFVGDPVPIVTARFG